MDGRAFKRVGGGTVGLKLSSVRFSYVKGKEIVKDLDMEVRTGELYSLLGSSGSGKSTILSLIAGFLRPMTGRVVLDSVDITDMPPEKRGVGMVFQDLSLFPHMSVLSNVMYGMRGKGSEEKGVKRRAMELIAMVGLEGMEERLPHQLSGGERQRVALVRTLAPGPKLVLLDEPLSALDPSLRTELRKELCTLLKELRTTALYVTHDRSEALSISDRIGLLQDGSIVEQGDPESMYWRPKRSKTALFMGMNNSLEVKGASRGYLLTDLGRVPWSGPAPKRLGFRPESAIEPTGPSEGLSIKGRVRSLDYNGRDWMAEVVTDRGTFIISFNGKSELTVGTVVKRSLPFRELCPLDSDT
ncbi:MAG: ABC transporter ATP-binding protein [Candidatus Thermoplasmatota archaeon]|nr:ABC transporter ATP-binding protein [Candidatus Thermoplasmatota archaeon]